TLLFPTGERVVYRIGAEPYMLFRLQEISEGIAESLLSNGREYLLVVPRDATISGPQRLDPEPLELEGWVAYLLAFERTQPVSVVFRGTTHHLSTGSVFLDFIGQRVPGLCERYRVFREPPRLRLLGFRATPVKIVLRLEGRPERPTWTRSFTMHRSEEAMPSEVREELLALGAGRFAVRCYDADGQLLGSDDLRLIVGLRQVRREALPDGRVKVTFDLESGYSARPVEHLLEVNEERGLPCFVIRPEQRQSSHALWDLLHWRVVAPNGHSVVIGVELGRTFFVLDDGDNDEPPPSERWGCQPLSLTLSDCRATSSKSLWIWLPPHFRPSILELGFHCGRGLVHWRVGAKRSPARFPLRTLSGLVEEACGEYELRLIGADGLSRRVAQLVIRAQCRSCRAVFATEEEVFEHIVTEHHSSIFVETPIEVAVEIQYIVLSDRACQCLYCNKLFLDSGLESAQSGVIRHQETECGAARREAKGGPVQLSFRVLERGALERMMAALYGRWWRCRVCGAELREENQRTHLRQKHLGALVGYV
ncbi:MAG: hypothetical protein NZL87_05445, partial [Thermomicrobium sp.]|nr:hypothetical protein [Thermomicrobium sp.]